jgi:hypothetical protein
MAFDGLHASLFPLRVYCGSISFSVKHMRVRINWLRHEA